MRQSQMKKKDSPTLGLEMITNTWPVDLFIKSLQTASFLRTRNQPRFSEDEMYTPTPCLKGHRQRLEEWLYANGCHGHTLTMIELDDLERQFIWNKKYEVDLSSITSGNKDVKGKARYDTTFAI